MNLLRLPRHYWSSGLLILVMTQAALAANPATLPGGVIHLRGMVTDGACAVDRESQNKNIIMGQVKSSQFKALGDWGEPVPFSLKLVDCDTAVSQQVGIALSGVTDGKDPLVFRAGYGPTAAEGIGIGVFDDSDLLIIPNTRPRSFSSLQSGTVILPFTAKYRATSRQVKAGDASSVVYFSLFYP